MNGIRFCRRLARISVLGLTALFAGCGQRGADESQPTAAAPVPPVIVAPVQQTSADRLGIPVQITNSIGMRLVLIPAGEFMMGSPITEECRARDEYQHAVRITKPFYLGVYEVTQAEYEQVTGANPSYFRGATKPVNNVSWVDATEFCKRLSAKEKNAYRLPTEAEWEYACRAGTTTLYSFGDDDARLGGYAIAEANCRSKWQSETSPSPIWKQRCSRPA